MKIGIRLHVLAEALLISLGVKREGHPTLESLWFPNQKQHKWDVKRNKMLQKIRSFGTVLPDFACSSPLRGTKTQHSHWKEPTKKIQQTYPQLTFIKSKRLHKELVCFTQECVCHHRSARNPCIKANSIRHGGILATKIKAKQTVYFNRHKIPLDCMECVLGSIL